jgi:UDP-N-acetylmuramyl pentapeptide phosphotransferase/UDP-N-acetylglucosamine-1-phosphate transferase
LIDGLNGLCSGICLCAFLAISSLSESIGYETMFHLSMMYVAGISAFLIFNFPFARLFLGDSGAYLLGFILSWFSIAVMLHSDSVSPWAFFLIFSYPIVDMLVSIIRRVAVGRSPFSPDAGHFHHLVLNAVGSIKFLDKHHRFHNPLATLAVLPVAVYPMVIGVVYYDNVQVLLLSSVGVVLIYCILFVLLRELRRRQQRDVENIALKKESEFS